MKNKPSVSGANECQTSSNTTASSSISLPQSQLYIRKVPSSIRLHQQNNFRKKSTSSRRTSYIRKRESEWRKMAAAEEEEGVSIQSVSLSLSLFLAADQTHCQPFSRNIINFIGRGAHRHAKRVYLRVCIPRSWINFLFFSRSSEGKIWRLMRFHCLELVGIKEKSREIGRSNDSWRNNKRSL